MELIERCEQALREWRSDDAEMRGEALIEIFRLCDEGVEHPTPYRISAGVLAEGKPVEAWRNVVQALGRWLELSDYDEENVEDAHYVCMQTALALEQAADGHGASMCCTQSIRFWAMLGNDFLEDAPDHIQSMLKRAVQRAIDELSTGNKIPIEYLQDTCEQTDFDLQSYIQDEYGV